MQTMRNCRRESKLVFLLVVVIVSVAVVCLLPVMPQDPMYHQFVDQAFLGIPHAANVLSNILFVWIGILGVACLMRRPLGLSFAYGYERWGFWLVFVGALFLGVGSAYYHLEPNNISMVWDRLPFVMVMMGLLAVIMSDRLYPKAGVYALPLLLLVGGIAVWYWQYSESLGQGDLRFYLWVETMPVVVMLLLLVWFPSRYTGTGYLWMTFGLYTLARIVDKLDQSIYSISAHSISGHTLKHLFAAAALFSLYCYLKYRRCYEHPMKPSCLP